MSSGGSKTGMVVGVGVGCLLLLCCVGTIGVWFAYTWNRSADLGAASWEQTLAEAEAVAEMADVAWGEIQLVATPTNVYATPSTTADVLESHDPGARLEYFGMDTSGAFFKVKTSGGVDGYVSAGEAELSVFQGQLRVVADRAVIYQTPSSEGTALELHQTGDLVDWYGYDASGQFYKVRTSSGADGYLQVVDAEIPY